MSLLVSQLIYTNLPKTGFQLLVSQQIPIEVKEAFVKEIVYEYWDAYNPPSDDYQAVYIHQLSSRYTLFGWLYNDGSDELGRAHIPYFLSYFFIGKLTEIHLQQLFQYLEIGPIDFIERSQLLGHGLEQFFLPEINTYQSPLPGFYIADEVKEKARKELKTGKRLKLLASFEQDRSSPLINASVAQDAETIEIIETKEVTKSVEMPGVTDVTYSEITEHFRESNGKITTESHTVSVQPLKTIDTDQIEQIFQEVIQEGLGIQGAVFISEEGRPLTNAIGIEHDKALMLAAKLLSLTTNFKTEMGWNSFDAIALHSSDGHLMLVPCLTDSFILIQAGQILTGLLEVEIKRMIRKIEAICQNNEIFVPFSPLWNDLESAEDLEGLLSKPEAEILYRGRRISQ